ncbi:hypothetical protein Q428_01850 [Fervidicella metallireducens AeB]|uniref:Uncharacterized protein n=1 Tax=Fervidicella metallireducens AeB TaxID=1403537 RepID=A0A017RYY4_9CLOT|nr:hypothetical protein [Fervidicella metallireducens]EYE89594.1 hypothetical protein Q428_01850 [Fervidicella metallireducens AeB]
MKKFRKIISLIVFALMILTNSICVFANEEGGKHFDYDKNDKFLSEYNKAVAKAKNVDELLQIIESYGFEKVKEVKTVTYYEEVDGKCIKSNKKKVIENGKEKFFIDEKEVDSKTFVSTFTSINSPELTLTMRQYRGKQIDQYITDQLNLVYDFSWSGIKIFDDLYGAWWDDNKVYKTSVSASSGLVYMNTDNTSRVFKVPASVKDGYINVMLKSRDGVISDDHGSATSEYRHSSFTNWMGRKFWC